jgi:hypothetical protein
MSFALDQVSGSLLLRGAKTVGHNEDLSFREVGVRAAVCGQAICTDRQVQCPGEEREAREKCREGA